jgi:acyl-coenzyme A thioesterase PaaI-like protein
MNTCFGCGEDNPRGLQLGPHAEIRDGGIHIEYRVPSDFEGFTGIVHGGIVAAILDEAMGMSCSRVHNIHGAVTANLNITFRSPVRTEVPLTIRARAERNERKFNCTAQIYGENDELLAEASSLWILPAGQPGSD